MKVSCDIIKDLLPLYAENLTSQASNEMVDEHLCQCDVCTKELGALKKAPKVPVEVDTNALKRVGNTIRRRKILTVAAALLTMVTVVLTICVYLMTPIYLNAVQAVEGVEFLEDGSVKVDYARGIMGHGGTTDGIVDIEQCQTTRWDWWKAKKLDREVAAMSQEEQESYIRDLYQLTEVTQHDWDRFFNIRFQYGSFVDDAGNVHLIPLADDERTKWYQNLDGSYTLIYGSGPEPVAEIVGNVKSEYPLLFVLCSGLAVALWLLAGKRKGWTWELARRFAILAVSVAFATLLVTGIRLGTGVAIHMNIEHWPKFIGCESVFLSLTLLFWHQLYLLNRQDKGE